MKEYPLTWQEILTLGAVQGGSALFFAVAGTLLGVWFNVGQSLAFAPKDSDRAITGYYEGVRDAALAGSLLCALIAVVLFVVSGWVVFGIRKNTRHD